MMIEIETKLLVKLIKESDRDADDCVALLNAAVHGVTPATIRDWFGYDHTPPFSEKQRMAFAVGIMGRLSLEKQYAVLQQANLQWDDDSVTPNDREDFMQLIKKNPKLSEKNKIKDE